jgi:hypothetical protein
MTNGVPASSGAAAYAAIARAIKASGVIVKVENSDFLSLLGRADKPLVVIAEKKWFSLSHKYLFSYKGLAFYTKSAEPLRLPGNIEIISAQRIWIP